MAISILFEQFIGKIFLKNFAPKSECFTKYDAFCSYIVDCASLGLPKTARFEIMEKLYSSKTYLKVAGGEGCMHPQYLPLPSLITMSLTTTPTSRFGFSMMRGKFCHSCFEITARTALAQFGHFTLKTRVKVRPPQPPWVRH